MADLIVDRCADALGETLIVERGGDPAMLDRKLMHERIDRFCRHARADMLGDLIQHAVVDRCRLTDQADVLRALDQRALRHHMPLQLHDIIAVIPLFMTLFVLLSAAAPAA